MRILARRSLFIVGVLSALIALSLIIMWQTRPQQVGENGLFALARPLFLETAHAEDSRMAALIDTEAGVAAYFQAPGPISLAIAKPLFRTIEAETDSYLIGSVAVPNYASESEDVHVYIHKDGWVLAYFLAATPAANLIDWPRFNGTVIVTKFDTVFQLVAAQLSFTPPATTYYDFRYPNANYLLLVAEAATDNDDFTVFLNESLTFYERSWSLSAESEPVTYLLNGTEIAQFDGSDDINVWEDLEGTLTTLQLPVNSTHTILIDGYNWGVVHQEYGGLALVYRRN